MRRLVDADKSKTSANVTKQATSIDQELIDLLHTAKLQRMLPAVEIALQEQFNTADAFTLKHEDKLTVLRLLKPLFVLNGLLRHVG